MWIVLQFEGMCICFLFYPLWIVRKRKCKRITNPCYFIYLSQKHQSSFYIWAMAAKDLTFTSTIFFLCSGIQNSDLITCHKQLIHIKYTIYTPIVNYFILPWYISICHILLVLIVFYEIQYGYGKYSYLQYIWFVTVIVNIWYLDSYNSFLEIISLTCMLQVNSISFSSDFSKHNLFSILHFFFSTWACFFHVGILELNYSYCYLFNVIIQWSLSNT